MAFDINKANSLTNNIEKFVEYCNEFQDDRNSLIMLGRLYEKLNKYDISIQYYKKGIKLNYYDMYAMLGNLHYNNNDNKKALKYFLLGEKNDNIDSMVSLANFFFAEEQYDKAMLILKKIKKYKIIKKKDKKDIYNIVNTTLALIYKHDKKYTLAEKLLLECKHPSATSRQILFFLASLYIKKK